MVIRSNNIYKLHEITVWYRYELKFIGDDRI